MIWLPFLSFDLFLSHNAIHHEAFTSEKAEASYLALPTCQTVSYGSLFFSINYLAPGILLEKQINELTHAPSGAYI